jgi:p-hydroxybenzoate 3-monooxygenase
MLTQVGIVGAGPAGLLLAHLLHQQGIQTVVIESRSQEYVERRVRAGVLEHGTVELLKANGLGERLEREGLRHEGTLLRFGGQTHRIDFPSLTGGKSVMVYGQQEVVKDLIQARLESGAALHFEAQGLRVAGLETDQPVISYLEHGQERTIHCDYIAGTDGFHGICRDAIPKGVLKVFERTYPFAWLGILAKAPPSSHELIYANHERGFALHSMRSPTITRNYLQVPPDENLDNWSDQRIWQELQQRLETSEGFELVTGEIFEKGITPMRSFVVEPMQYGRMFLAGDAAHIVPPTGAKGMNLAINDVKILSNALTQKYQHGSGMALEQYSQNCLRRVWRAQYFSWWMTSMLHRHDQSDPYEHKLQLAQLEQVVSSRAQAQVLAENYVGMLDSRGLE